MRVKLKLVILSFDVDNRSYMSVYDKNDFPSKCITKDSIDKNLDQLIKQYLDTDPTWIDKHLLDAISKTTSSGSNIINLYYTCLIPFIINTKKGKWINVEQIEQENNKFIFKAIHKTIR